LPDEALAGLGLDGLGLDGFDPDGPEADGGGFLSAFLDDFPPAQSAAVLRTIQLLVQRARPEHGRPERGR
ncbi:hypothetical protein ACFWDP_36855, partial [Streptomyces anthocyanicus]